MVNIWRGEKITLRPLVKEDIDGFCDVNKIDTDIQRLSGMITFPISRSRMEKILDSMTSSSGNSNDQFHWIIENKNGDAVGDISTSDCNRRFGTFKYGIGINKDHWGKGYGTEAVKIVLNFYFNELRYQKVTASVYSFNHQSINFHKKLGFKEEGRLRRMVYTDGEYYDEVIFGMTGEEFNDK